MTALVLAMASVIAPGAEVPWDLADAVAMVAEEAPLPEGPEYTAALLVVTAWEESRFERTARGDSGKSAGYFGLWCGGYERKCRSVEDAWGAARMALAWHHESRRVCRSLPKAEQQALYLSGTCDRGLALSRRRSWLTRVAMRAVGGAT